MYAHLIMIIEKLDELKDKLDKLTTDSNEFAVDDYKKRIKALENHIRKDTKRIYELEELICELRKKLDN